MSTLAVLFVSKSPSPRVYRVSPCIPYFKAARHRITRQLLCAETTHRDHAAVRRAKVVHSIANNHLRGKPAHVSDVEDNIPVPPLRAHVPHCEHIARCMRRWKLYCRVQRCRLCVHIAANSSPSLLQWATRMWHQGSRDIALQRLRVDALRWRAAQSSLFRRLRDGRSFIIGRSFIEFCHCPLPSLLEIGH